MHSKKQPKYDITSNCPYIEDKAIIA